jgi:hypothetical protein
MFGEVSSSAGTWDTGNGEGAAWGDYDDDGDLDLYVVRDHQPNQLFRNAVGNSNHWLRVSLVGVQSNRAGIGARVEVVVGGVRQSREIEGGAGCLSQNSLAAEFGLGAATVVDLLTIRWPSGIVWDSASVAVDQRLTVVEHRRRVGVGEQTPLAFALHPNQPNPFVGRTAIRFDLPRRAAVSVRIYDVRGRLMRALADGSVLEPGRHRLTWDGSLRGPGRAAPGVYFCEFRTEGFRSVKRIVMLR